MGIISQGYIQQKSLLWNIFNIKKCHHFCNYMHKDEVKYIIKCPDLFIHIFHKAYIICFIFYCRSGNVIPSFVRGHKPNWLIMIMFTSIYSLSCVCTTGFYNIIYVWNMEGVTIVQLKALDMTSLFIWLFTGLSCNTLPSPLQFYVSIEIWYQIFSRSDWMKKWLGNVYLCLQSNC